MKTLKIVNEVKIKKFGKIYEAILGSRQLLVSPHLVKEDSKALRFPLYNAKAKDIGGGLVAIIEADGWVLDYIRVEGVSESVPVYIVMRPDTEWELVELDDGYLFSCKSSFTIDWSRDLLNTDRDAIIIEDDKGDGVLWIYTGLKNYQKGV
jgi:hypothetical protein